VLLVHGYPLSRKLWEPQLSGLSDIARLIALNLRGHGESEVGNNNPGAFSMEMLADDCATFLDALEVNEPVILGGLSMGGYVVLAFARKYPERLAGLILAATRVGPDSVEGKTNREKAVAQAKEGGAVAIAEAMLPKMMSPHTYTANPQLASQVREMMTGTSVPGIIGDLLGMRDRPDSTSILPGIKVPTLLLYGADDQIIPQGEMEQMAAAIPGAQLVVVPQAGHLLNLEQPDEFNQSLRVFLNQIKK
jgi:3-oxoadipate enol-lactonase